MPKDANQTLSTLPAPRDGAAALYGFLYQLTASLYRVSSLVTAASGTITAVFEPKGGGDLGLASNGERRAIQFKQRQTNLTGPEIATSVIPDLFRSHCHGPSDVYELQATQPPSGPAQALVANLVEANEPDEKTRDYLARAKGACLGIYDSVHGTGSAGFDEAYAEFVSRFTIGPVLKPAEAERETKDWLVKQLLHAELLDEKFDQILGRLFKLSSQNDATFTQEDLLLLIGGRNLEDMSPVTQTERLKDKLRKAFGSRQYRLEWDIRAPVQIDSLKKVTRITGESGYGKSWRSIARQPT